MSKLTLKQSNFLHEYLTNGGNASAAYRVAYDTENMKDTTINAKAYELLQNGEITDRIEQHKKELMMKALWSREEAVATLRGVITNAEKGTEVIAAVRELNAMHGFNLPQKKEENRISLADFVRERHEKHKQKGIILPPLPSDDANKC